MFVGHYGVSFAAQRMNRQVPLWVLFIAVQLLDVFWAPFVLLGIEKVRIAWAGGAQPGQPHYYRLMGPTFLVEYDNTQNNANHIHTVWRDLKNDFGDDILRQHYEQNPH